MAMSVVIPPAAFDDSDPVPELMELMEHAGLAPLPADEELFHVASGCGQADHLRSLLRRLTERDRSAGRRTAHYVYDCPHPRGFSEEAAAGLPSFMSVGEDEDGPFFYCAIHRQKHIGLADVAHERLMAADHVTTFHSAGGAR